MAVDAPRITIAQERRKPFRAVYRKLGRILPTPYFVLRHYMGLKQLGVDRRRDAMFTAMLAEHTTGPCLQVGVKEDVGCKFGDNWTCIDLYDDRKFVDHNYDVQAMPFQDESFDAIVCISILEHVPHPQQAVAEMYRVLRPGGDIWIQLPFCYPFHELPHDYWRVSPAGLRIWMGRFEEIACGSYNFTRSSLAVTTYFYGKK